MKNRGFTLIELLSVMIILSVILLIAIPIILNIIEGATEESNKRSIEMYAKALNNSILMYKTNSKNKISGAYETTDGHLLNKVTNSTDKVELNVIYEGDVFCKSVEIYNDGSYYLSKCYVDKELVDYTYGRDQSYDVGQIVYFDVSKGVACSEKDYHEDNSITGYNGIYEGENSRKTTNNQNGCLKFYVFGDSIINEKINLILDHNTSSQIAWSVDFYNKNGPTEIIPQLYRDTEQWKGTLEPQSYTMNQLGQKSNVEYTIDYKNFKARLIEAQEVAQITQANEILEWNESSSTNWYYLNGSKDEDLLWQTQVLDSSLKSDYGWLYDRTSSSCKTSGCLNNSDSNSTSYWTASTTASGGCNAWYISSNGSIRVSNYINNLNKFGVRPVIEVLKSSL